MSDEEKEILNNVKEYMQDSIDKGHHKFFYNDLGWDFKCIDCINAIDKVLKQSKELEDLKDIQQQICNEELFTKEYVDKLRKEIEELKENILIHKEYNKGYFQGRRDERDETDNEIKAKIEELEIEQESNREDLKIAIDNLQFQNIDKIADKISINMSVRGILQSLLEKE